MKFNKYIGILILFTAFTNALWAQKKATTNPPKPRAKYVPETVKIAVLASPKKDSILLRWAPTEAQAWFSLNKTGYQIKRVTILRDGELLPKPEIKILTQSPIKPMPLEGWKPMVDAEDKYGSIAAQALYGESFEVSRTGNESSIAQIINRTKDNQARFSFALFSADQNYKVAKSMGLAYVDHSIKSNEKYVYKIFPAAIDNTLKIDTGFVFVGAADFEPLPKPYDLRAEQQKKAVMLSWNQEVLARVYSNYLVERSDDDGKTFKLLSELPVVNTYEEGKKPNRNAFKLDTIPAVGKSRLYRIKGISAFGEIGPSSDTLRVVVSPDLELSPSITKAESEGNSVVINWEMPPQEAEILGFDVERTSNLEKPFVKINTERINNTTFSFIDKKPANSNYYRIRAFGKNRISKISYPVLAQMIDSIPPSKPTFVEGTIDKKGIANIKWKANTEADLAGYRVYRSNTKDGEFSQITRKALLKNNFIDTVEVKTLTRDVFYKIVAIDKRFNPSDFSDVLKVERPDVIPPMPPSFVSVENSTKGIILTWNNSGSDDVENHILLRSPENETFWSEIATFTNNEKQFIDTTANLKIAYKYSLRANDKSGLFSMSAPVVGKRIDLGLKPSIVNFMAKRNPETQFVDLKWAYNQPDVEMFLLYRAEVGSPMQLYQTLDVSKNNQFTDEMVVVGKEYQYRLKAKFADGKETPFSKPITVSLK